MGEYRMSKYAPLTQHLITLAKPIWHTTFSEVERILGFSLPPSARSYQAWWANSFDNLPQHRAWLEAGWETADLNLRAEHVLFRRTAPTAPAQKLPMALAPTVPFKQPDPHPWDAEARKLLFGAGMTWRPLGRVERDESGRLVLPAAPSLPGIYCFRVRQSQAERRYIGESDNLARRFANYRTPGSSQPTNIRINTLLLEALGTGAEVSASIVVDGAWINWGKEPLKLDLSSKAGRRLLENAAILESGAIEIEMLNRE